MNTIRLLLLVALTGLALYLWNHRAAHVDVDATIASTNGFVALPAPTNVDGNKVIVFHGVQNDAITPQVVAPALDVISTFNYTYTWNAGIHCGDTYGPNFGDLPNGYGDCTGTSMASPHIAGLVALMRSANPLMSKSAIKVALLASTAPCTGTDASKCGAGIPNAAKAVRSAIGANAKNRLTPLFSFYSSGAHDHLYTIYPQMSLAALYAGQMLPQPPPPASIAYSTLGNTIPQYAQFPQPSSCFSPCPAAATPRAMVSVFTSHVDPTDASAELVPLYRMSWSCSGTCGHVSHVYTTSSTGISAFQSSGYVVDGIEGYIYPSTKAQPPRTVKVCRKYSNTTDDDYILFAGTGSTGTTCGNGDGFTEDSYGTVRTDYTTNVGSTDWIGWAYPVQASQAICTGGVSCDALAALLLLLNDD